MYCHRVLPVVCLLLGATCTPLFGTDQPQSSASNPASSKLTSESRVMLIRGLQSEHAFTKYTFPMGKKGLLLKNGKVSPDGMKLQQVVAKEGPAAKAGDRVQITSFIISGHDLIFEINGGPRKSGKWYNHISVIGMGGEAPIKPQDPATANAKGSILTLAFDGEVPNLTVDEVKKLLAPVFDFTPMSQVEAYQTTLPKIVQDAIKNHKVLVGMDRDMVIYSVGRPDKKYRDKDAGGSDYEEWIYGNPPAEVQFVRFVGNEVARLEIMTVDGEKIVKTEKEFQLAVRKAEPTEAKAAQKKPSLLAPGEDAPDKATPTTHINTIPPMDGGASPRNPADPGQSPGQAPPVPQNPTQR